MRHLTRLIVSILLVASFTLGTVAASGARAQMALGDSMVLCIGAEQVRVALDARGQPLLDADGVPQSAHDLCAACVLGALALSDNPNPTLGGVLIGSDAPRSAISSGPAFVPQGGQARAPPVAA